MKRVLLAFSILSVGLSFGQAVQSSGTHCRITVGQSSRNQPATTPTSSDIYCAGYITTEKLPETHYVVGGLNTPDQTKYHSSSDWVYIYGSGLKEGDRIQIVRKVRDPNRYEAYKGQKAAVKTAGQTYFERGYARIKNVQRNVGIAQMELACGETLPGDIAIPFVERERPVLR